MIKRKKNPPVFPQSRRRTFPNLWPFILPFPSSFVALVSSHLLPLSSSRFDSQAHWLTSMINGWQTAAILRAVKCVLSRNDTVVSCHLLQTTCHSRREATYRRNVFHPHLEATADSKVLEKRDETAHLSSPRPVHLVRGLAQNGVSTISNSICLCRMKKGRHFGYYVSASDPRTNSARATSKEGQLGPVPSSPPSTHCCCLLFSETLSSKSDGAWRRMQPRTIKQAKE